MEQQQIEKEKREIREKEFLKYQQEQQQDKKPKDKLKITCECGTEMIVPITPMMWGLEYFCPNPSCKKIGVYKL